LAVITKDTTVFFGGFFCGIWQIGKPGHNWSNKKAIGLRFLTYKGQHK
jgi:hypothetical protein